MEEEFIKLEKEIDPVKEGFLELLKLKQIEKIKVIDFESVKVLKQQTDMYKIKFDTASVSRQFNWEHQMPHM